MWGSRWQLRFSSVCTEKQKPPGISGCWNTGQDGRVQPHQRRIPVGPGNAAAACLWAARASTRAQGSQDREPRLLGRRHLQAQSRAPQPLQLAHGPAAIWEPPSFTPVTPPRGRAGETFPGLGNEKSDASKNSRWVKPSTDVASLFALPARKLRATLPAGLQEPQGPLAEACWRPPESCGH